MMVKVPPGTPKKDIAFHQEEAMSFFISENMVS